MQRRGGCGQPGSRKMAMRFKIVYLGYSVVPSEARNGKVRQGGDLPDSLLIPDTAAHGPRIHALSNSSHLL